MIKSKCSSPITISRSRITSFLSIETTSPVSSSTKSSIQVFKTLAASLLPTNFFMFALLILISSASPNILGDSYSEQILKDYNGQTYWLSANLFLFTKSSKVPKWVNLALGYGAEGMITGNDDFVNTVFLPEDKRFRQIYLSLDVDLTKIKSKSHFIKTLFSVINTIKIPAPTVEFRESGTVKFHLLYF